MHWRRSCSGLTVVLIYASCLLLTCLSQWVMMSFSQDGCTRSRRLPWCWANYEAAHQLNCQQLFLSAEKTTSYVKSVVLLMKKLPSVWSRHSYLADRTTVILHLLVCPSRLLDRCSVYRTLLLVSLLIVSQGITSLVFSCVCTGCLWNHGLHTNCASRCTLFTPTSGLITWLTWLNWLQQTHRDLASNLPVTSCTGRDRKSVV